MTIQTNPTDRREMVRAISEYLQTPAVYQRMPTCAYRIGGITVDRDGSLASDDEALLAHIRPLLVERGWLDEELTTNPATKAEEVTYGEDSEALRKRVYSICDEIGWLGGYTKEEMEEAFAQIPRAYYKTDPETAGPGPGTGLTPEPETPMKEHSGPPEGGTGQAGHPAGRMDIITPLEGWTVAGMANLLRMLYSRQYLLNRMMQGETLFIEGSVIAAIAEDPPADAADFEALVQRETGNGRIRGAAFEGGKLIFSTPCSPGQTNRWMACNTLLAGILKRAKNAKRVLLDPRTDPENEKHYAHIWLVRMGFSGPKYKELRHTLMHHLNGYAAFKSAAGMQAHREKYAAIRRQQREAAQTKDEIESREASE